MTGSASEWRLWNHMPIIPGSHRIHSQSFGLQGRSTEHLESAEHHGHSHQRSEEPRTPSGDSGTGLAIGLVDRRTRLVGQGTGLETVG
jgi:hypothetical protein